MTTWYPVNDDHDDYVDLAQFFRIYVHGERPVIDEPLKFCVWGNYSQVGGRALLAGPFDDKKTAVTILHQILSLFKGIVAGRP